MAYKGIIQYKRHDNIGDAMIEMAKTDNTKLGWCVVYLYTEYTGDYNTNKIEWDSIADKKYVAIKTRIENN